MRLFQVQTKAAVTIVYKASAEIYSLVFLAFAFSLQVHKRRLGHVQRRQLDKGLTQEGRVVPKHCRFTNLL